MSRVSIALLYVVIAAIIVCMYFEVPYISGLPGALIVISLVYSFVVAKREAALIAFTLDEQRRQSQPKPHSRAKGEADDEEGDSVIVPEWLQNLPSVPRQSRFR